MQTVMNCTPVKKLYTAEELFNLPELDNGRWHELIRGELALNEPAGTEHSGIEATLIIVLGSYVLQRKLGRIFSGDAGFTLERGPDTVLAPDVSFVKSERVPYRLPKGYFEGAPDLAVEIQSPSQTLKSQIAKIQIYLKTGTQLAWLINPTKQNAIIFRADGSSAIIESDGFLSGENIIPGFTCQLSALFE